MNEVFVRLLGSLEVEVGGVPIVIAGRRERKVLAMLALHANRHVSTDMLVDVLWEEPPRSARQQVYNAITAVRRALAPASSWLSVDSGNGGYQLRAPREAIDLNRFHDALQAAETARGKDRIGTAVEALTAAVRMWRGPALSGLAGQYFEGTATRINELRLQAMEQLAEYRTDGDLGLLANELSALAAEYPLRESLYAAQMTVLVGAGRRAEALAVFDGARQVLVRELGIEPGERLAGLRQLALAEPPATPPTPAEAGEPDEERDCPGSVRRCFLPRDAADFCGRGAQIEQIRALVLAGCPTVTTCVAISGMGGTGKTTLAVRVAHMLAREFPDGQYFVDLQGFTSGAAPLSSSQALEALLRDSGMSAEKIPSQAHQRSAAWRDHVAGRRVIVVIDNAVNDAQVRPLLPNTGGSAVILTSRRRLSALTGTILHLDCMPVEEARELFTTIAGADRVAGQDAALDAAIELCGRLPLAIRIAAALLRDRSAWQVPYLVEKLKQERGRDRLLQFDGTRVQDVAALSYRHLTAEQRAVFRMLGGTPCLDFDAFATAALADISVEDAENELEALLDDNLIQQRVAGRYQLHDVVKSYARELWQSEATETDRELALRRLLDYYLGLVAELCRPMASAPFRLKPDLASGVKQLPECPEPATAHSLLAVERANVIAVVELSETYGFHAQCWQLACLFQPYLKMVNFGPDAEDVFERAYNAALAAGDERGAGLSLFALSRGVYVREEPDRTRNLLARACDLTGRAEDRVTGLYQRIFHASLLHEDMLLEEACRTLECARETAAELGDVYGLTVIENNLGLLWRDLGDYPRALDSFRRSLAHGERISHAQTAVTLANVGLEHVRCRDLGEAERVLAEALRTSRTPSYPYAEISALMNYAVLKRSVYDFTASVESCLAAAALAADSGFHQMQCQAAIHLGDTFLAMGELSRSGEAYQRAYGRCADDSRRRVRGWALEGLAHVSLALGRPHEARTRWLEALRLYPELLGEAAAARRHLAALDAGGPPFGHCGHCIPTPRSAATVALATGGSGPRPAGFGL